MINAQILAKTLVSPGQDAQTFQSKQSGSNSTRTQETVRDTSDPSATNIASRKDAKTGENKESSDQTDFEQALNEKMAESKPEHPPEERPEEPPAESQDSTATMLQPVVAPTPEVSVIAEVVAQSNNGPNEPVAPTMPVINPVETSINPVETSINPVETSINMFAEPVKGPTESEASIKPTSSTPELFSAESMEQGQTQEPVSTANSGPIQTQELPVALSAEPVQTPELLVTPGDAGPTTQDTPLQQIEVSEGQASHKPIDPQAAYTENIKPQSELIEPVQPQPVTQAQKTSVVPVGAMPETSAPKPTSTPKPAFDIQSMPQETNTNIKSTVEPLNVPLVDPKPQADGPERVEVTHPIPQAVTTQLESSGAQPVAAQASGTSDAEALMQTTQSTAPVSPASETQATSASGEASLPRTLDPGTTSVARQIQDSIAQGIQQDGREIIIRLDPPELGRVAIRFQEGALGITGILEVQRPQTRNDIQYALPEIIQSLQDNGVQVKRVEVLLSTDADRETLEDQASAQAQDQNLTQEQNPEQNSAQRSSPFRWASSSDQGVHDPTQQEYVSDQGINMLI